MLSDVEVDPVPLEIQVGAQICLWGLDLALSED